MSEKIRRLKALPGSISRTPKKPDPTGVEVLVSDFKTLLDTQAKERQELIQTLNKLSSSINSGNAGSADLASAVKSIESLAQALSANKGGIEYKLSGKRDSNGLIDLNSIKFTSYNRKLN